MCSRFRLVVLALAVIMLGALLIPVAQGADLFAVYWTAAGTNGSVKRFDGTTGAFISDFVAPGSGGLQAPYDVDFGPDGNLYVSDYTTQSIKRYNGTTGAFIDTFISGIVAGVDGPNGVQFGPDGNIYTQPYGAPWVLKHDGTTGASMGRFCEISGGSVRDFFWTPAGEMLVMSPSLNKVVRFAADGTSLAEYPMQGTSAGARFTVCASEAGDIYVGAMNNNSIEKYDANGNFVSELVTNASGGLSQTSRVRIGPDGNLYASSYNAPTMTTIKKYSIVDGTYLGDFATGFTNGTWGMRWKIPPKPGIIGTVAIADYSGPADLVRAKVELLKNSEVASTKWVDGGAGSFEFAGLDRGGQYQVRLSACKWVTQTISVTLAQTGASDLGTITLANGNVVGDDAVDTTDLSVVISNL